MNNANNSRGSILISIIIPIYKGIQYIDMQIKQAEAAAKRTPVPMELIFVNDYPETPLPEKLQADGLEVVVLQTDKNCGIQGARIKGLEAAKGSYIHFLDQDDEVFPEFYASQYSRIDDADVIFCRCYNGNRQVYNKDRVLETAFAKEKIFGCCPMISPGQALVRKEAVPEFWKAQRLKHQGSDDYMLWLSMVAEGAKAVCNQDVLFRHVLTGDNYSADVLKAYESDAEMAELLLEHKIFGEEDEEKVRAIPWINLQRRYRPQKNAQATLRVLEKLLAAEERGASLAVYLKQKGYKNIAIYGAATLGERLYGLLKNTGIQVTCFIDRNAKYLEEEIPVCELKDVSCDVDAVLISNIINEAKIEEDIQGQLSVPTPWIRKIVEELKNKPERD